MPRAPRAIRTRHSQHPSRFTLNACPAGIRLAAISPEHWVRAVVERLDWKARAAARKKSRKSWDAIRQLIHYSEVVGRDTPISEQSLENGDLFRDARRGPNSSINPD
jgi:hypothetical protein